MKRSVRYHVLLGALCSCTASLAVMAGSYETTAQLAANWLTANMASSDGSWGTTDDVKYLDTSEVVLAFRAFDQLTPAYYEGVTWLENNFPENADYRARRVLALSANGSSVTEDLSYLDSIRYPALPASVSGFGLSGNYLGSSLDTALALQAFQQAGLPEDTAGVAFLEEAQLTGSDPGWAVAEETTSDPTTTAQVLLALLAYQSTDSTVVAPIANGLAALNADVTTSSPVPLQALAALVNLRNNPTSPQASTFLSALAASQASDGSWGEDPYATALALRAFSASLGTDAASNEQAVEIDDPNLRAAINQTLGRSALDALNQGELAQLTSLNIAGQGINDLNGLQYATNLTYLNAENNNISSFSPVSDLAGATILEEGNPGQPPVATNAGGGDGSGPTLPQWGVILLGLLLLWIAHTGGFGRAGLASAGRRSGSRR